MLAWISSPSLNDLILVFIFLHELLNEVFIIFLLRWWEVVHCRQIFSNERADDRPSLGYKVPIFDVHMINDPFDHIHIMQDAWSSTNSMEKRIGHINVCNFWNRNPILCCDYSSCDFGPSSLKILYMASQVATLASWVHAVSENIPCIFVTLGGGEIGCCWMRIFLLGLAGQDISPEFWLRHFSWILFIRTSMRGKNTRMTSAYT